MTKKQLRSKVNARSLKRKKSAFIKPGHSGGYTRTATRRLMRIAAHGFSDTSSTKIGAGDITARRRLPMDVVHRRNHRTNDLIGPKF